MDDFLAVKKVACDILPLKWISFYLKKEDISGMRLVRQVDDRLINTFTIPKGTVLETDPSRRLIKVSHYRGCAITFQSLNVNEETERACHR